jgi:hypothetical protein
MGITAFTKGYRSIFTTPRAKRFEYEPRYYDPQKEVRDERNRRILRELDNEKNSGSSTGVYRQMERGDMKHYISFGRKARSSAHKGTILLRIFTVILALVVALLVFYGTWVLVKLV